MTTEERKIQLGVGVDATDAKQGFEGIKQAGRDMAQSVAQSGQVAAQGLSGVGDKGEQAAQKLDRATKSMADSIQRTTAVQAAGERGTRAYYEALAAARGIDANLLKPYLDQLEAVTLKQQAAQAAQNAGAASLDKVGVSAKQTAAALRGVPAQFTDIITSLQGGQAPLTVFLQQGGQLKDMFGGAGAAAKALGGYVLGLINPYTVTAAATLGLVLAHEKGASEFREFQTALILSGNAAGVTADRLAQASKAVAALGGGTQGRAAEVLTQIASSGAVGSANLERFTAAAIKFETVGGQAASETAKAFAELAKSPLEGSLKLNQSMNYLTASSYNQIRALELQGRTTDAARVAQEAFAASLEQRTPQMLQSLGYVERAWLAIKGAVKGAGDAVLDIGRGGDNVSRLQTLQDNLRARQERNASLGIKDGKASQELQDQINLVSRRLLVEQEIAAAQGLQASQIKARAEFEKEGLKLLTDEQKLNNDIKEARNKGREAGLDEEAIQKRINALKADYAKKHQGSINDGYNSTIEQLKQQLVLEDAVAKRQKDRIAFETRMRYIKEEDAVEQTADIEIKRINARIDLTTREIGVAAKKKDSLKEQAALEGQLAVLFAQRADAEQEKEERLAEIQKRKLEYARLFYAAEEQQGRDDEAQAEVERTQQIYAGRQAVIDYAKAIDESNDATAYELTLLGKGSQARDILLEQYRIEIDRRKQILAINSNKGFNEDQRVEERIKANEAAARATAGVAGRVQVDEFKKTVDQMDDVFRKGFADLVNGGTGTWKSFTQSLATTFKTTVADQIYKMFLQPFVVNVVANMLGVTGGGGGLGGLANAGSSGNGVLGMAQNLNSLSNLYSKGSKFFDQASTWVKGYFGIGAGAGDAAGMMTTGEALGEGFASYMASSGYFSSGTALSAAAGTELGGSAAVMALDATTASGAAAGGTAGAASSVSVVPIIGWIIAGMMASNSLFAKGFKGENLDEPEMLAGLGFEPTLMTNKYLTALGVDSKWANIISGAPLTTYALSLLGIQGGESRGGGQYGYSADGTSVFNPRRGETYTNENMNQGAAISGKGVYFLEGPDGGQIAGDAVKEAISKTVLGIDELLKSVDSKASVAMFTAGLESSRKDRGGVFSGGKLSDGTIFGEQGTGSNYDGNLFEGNSDQSPDPRKALQDFSLDLQQVALQALQVASDTPKTVQTALAAALESVRDKDADRAPTIEELNADQVKTVLQSLAGFISTIGEFRKALEQLPFANLKALSFDAATNLIGFAGGLDKLNGDLSGYFTNYYSEAEQTQTKTDYVAKAFKDLGLVMPDLTQKSEEARAQFRALVAGIDPSTDAGGKQLAALLNLQQAFADLTPVMKDASNVLAERKQLEQQLLELQGNTAELRARELAALDASNRALQEQIYALQDWKAAQDDALAAVQRSVDAQKTALQQQRAVWQEAATAAQDVFDTLTDPIAELRQQASGSQSAAQGRQFVAQALTTARVTGYLPDSDALSRAVSAARDGMVASNYSTKGEFDRDRLNLAAQLEELQGIAGTQKSIDQLQLDGIDAQVKQLEAMVASDKDMLDELRGIKTGVLAWPDAQQKFLESLLKPGTAVQTLGPRPVGGSGPALGGSAAGGVYARSLDDLKALGATFTGTEDVRGLLEAGKARGYSLSDFTAAFGYTYEDWVKAAQASGIPGFASGGYYPGGLALLGEHGPELVNFSQPAQVYTSAQTSALLGGGNALIEEIKALRTEVAGQRRTLLRISASSAKTAVAFSNGPVLMESI